MRYVTQMSTDDIEEQYENEFSQMSDKFVDCIAKVRHNFTHDEIKLAFEEALDMYDKEKDFA